MDLFEVVVFCSFLTSTNSDRRLLIVIYPQHQVTPSLANGRSNVRFTHFTTNCLQDRAIISNMNSLSRESESESVLPYDALNNHLKCKLRILKKKKN